MMDKAHGWGHGHSQNTTPNPPKSFVNHEAKPYHKLKTYVDHHALHGYMVAFILCIINIYSSLGITWWCSFLCLFLKGGTHHLALVWGVVILYL
jgi:hypothetical protein